MGEVLALIHDLAIETLFNLSRPIHYPTLAYDVSLLYLLSFYYHRYVCTLISISTRFHI